MYTSPVIVRDGADDTVSFNMTLLVLAKSMSLSWCPIKFKNKIVHSTNN
jgi:hypothetical protein